VKAEEKPGSRLARAGEENQLRHRHLRLRVVPRPTDQEMRDGGDRKQNHRRG